MKRSLAYYLLAVLCKLNRSKIVDWQVANVNTDIEFENQKHEGLLSHKDFKTYT